MSQLPGAGRGCRGGTSFPPAAGRGCGGATPPEAAGRGCSGATPPEATGRGRGGAVRDKIPSLYRTKSPGIIRCLGRFDIPRYLSL
jgi:hypothetical protein